MNKINEGINYVPRTCPVAVANTEDDFLLKTRQHALIFPASVAVLRHACCDVIKPTVSSVAACCVRPTAHALKPNSITLSGSKLVGNRLRTSPESASVMEFGIHYALSMTVTQQFFVIFVPGDLDL